MFGKLLYNSPNGIVVREKAFSKFATETKTLNKVVGVTDMMLWATRQQVFCELTPSEIKKYTTGDARADKLLVAACMESYVGEQKYLCDDESDAVAVAIAFLIKEGYLDFVEAKEVDIYARAGKITPCADE